ncbi:DUF2480 family protein [Vicingus serpentipes]|uniref:DUF2480 family protein n=1 Tax=Vicingus serpentipes TaxID=1926625 RepID=A0A5C6RNS6_9FLAO|nr:DUF2480 family protein [Vicingus serpentipes]TXB64001.1 DUF2480 family protein [Vicingus serpentipes]
MENEIINRVEKSGLLQVNLDDYYPKGERVTFDLKNILVNEFVLIEKDFRAFVKNNDWSVYQNQYVNVICSADAIVPLWAFMLIVSSIKPYAKKVVMGNQQDLEKAIFNDIFDALDFTEFADKNVIVKGCGHHPIPESVFVDFTNRLQDVAKNIMFGEACSAVPLYKKK